MRPGKLGDHLFAIITLLIVTACGGPAVRISAVDGRVQQVESWSIVWEGEDVNNPTLELFSKSARSKYTVPEFAIAYANEVREILRNEYDLNTTQNFVNIGKLSIRLFADKLSPALGDTASEKRSLRRMQDPFKPTADYPANLSASRTAGELIAAGLALLSSKDRIRKVIVEIIDQDGEQLGTVFVGGSGKDNVKPKHVAEAIDRAIRGEFKDGRPVTPD